MRGTRHACPSGVRQVVLAAALFLGVRGVGAQPDLIPHGVVFRPAVAALGQDITVHIDVRCWGRLPDRGFRVGFWQHEPRAPVVWPWEKGSGGDPRARFAPEFLSGPDHYWVVGPLPERPRQPSPNGAKWLEKNPSAEAAELVLVAGGCWQARERPGAMLDWTFVPNGNGLRTPWVAVDAFDDVLERDEHNNEVHAEYKSRSGDGPDLHIAEFTVTPAVVTEGQEVTYSVTVANAGTQPAGPFSVHAWPNRATAAHAGISGAEGAAFGWDVPGLAAGERTTLSKSAKAGEPGERRAWVLADSGDRLVEANEADNVADVAYEVKRPARR